MRIIIIKNIKKKKKKKYIYISLSAMMCRQYGNSQHFRVGETGVGKMGQIIGKTGVVEMGVIQIFRSQTSGHTDS